MSYPEPAAQPRWILADQGSILRREIGDAVMLFDRRSGQTHLLNDVAMAAFDLLATPLDKAGLAAALASRIQVQVGPEIETAAERCLGSFDRLGLIRPVAS